MKKESTTDNEKNRVAVASLLVAIFLTIFKAVVGFATGSLGIISEAMHSEMDVFAAGLTAFSVRLSSKPPDEKHNFGHGKIENISALIEGLILVATCVWIVWEAVERLTGKETHIVVNFWSFFVVIFAIIVDLNRAKILSKMAKKAQKPSIRSRCPPFLFRYTLFWCSSFRLNLNLFQYPYSRFYSRFVRFYDCFIYVRQAFTSCDR
jgi:cation diffusion facilitator family transporter